MTTLEMGLILVAILALAGWGAWLWFVGPPKWPRRRTRDRKS